ncbi:hypothetical protein AVEN_204340-1 [Araneus ventricosus]|uniref:CCHC-type domain-containing protein n=1 Tax=Araneus ventricosus TaxID=182803 RepID=A0A4Y2PV14_ARAVE|nr:hypothetical protein AVEN_204340-1 [Araneus ventricosus]
MRIVFDASSSHSFQHLSLNDCLWPGPNLNSNIFDILINFRLNKFAIISDIEKAFLQITLAEKDRDAVRFLWTENDSLQVYRFNRVLFGVRSSPFLLSASIKTHLKNSVMSFRPRLKHKSYSFGFCIGSYLRFLYRVLKRFFSRRGKSSKLFSDNAKIFVGASIELKKLYKMVSHPNEILANFLLSENIEWKFIPPKSPNFGGLREAGVKSFKHLKRVVGNANLTLEEFLTVILEIESVLNSRPLTPLSTKFDNFETLSPDHFRIGFKVGSVKKFETFYPIGGAHDLCVAPTGVIIASTVSPHSALNSSKGVITCGRLLNLSNEEITQELGSQGVKDVRRINIRRNGELLPTKHFILTFSTPRLPEYIKAGYVRCSVRPYIPNPLRCFKCQRFGHSKTNCRGTLTCARCAAAGHESTDCNAVEKCVNCDGKHTSFSRSCPKWKVEKEIVATKFKNISFPEARRLVKAQTPQDVPSTSKSPEPVAIASSSCTTNKNILPKPSSQTSAVSQDSFGFTIVNRKKKPKISANSPSVNNKQIKANTATKFWTKSPRSSASEKAKNKILKNKTDKNKISTDKTANSTSESSEGNSSDTDSDITVTSAPEASNTQKKQGKIQI